jgi:RHS repeat-associated protein
MKRLVSTLAMVWAMAVCAQTATQNYVLSQTMLDDHQGNNRLVMSEDGVVEQVNYYTPFGVQMKNSFAETSDQRYKYNGKELDRMLGLDLYDYGARFYDARIARWQTIDPLCKKYYSISPYAYCANNPIRFIDPDGKDQWDINNIGEIVKQIKDNSNDTFYIVDNEGNRVEDKSLTLPYKTIISSYSKKDDLGTDYATFKVRGDSFSTELFEFLAQNISVELSQVKTGIEGKSGLNFITTSHAHSEERGMSDLLVNQLQYGYTVRDLYHSHPENTPYPSGLYSGKGDKQFSINVIRLLKQTPSFKIYTPQNGAYIPYCPNSTNLDFGLPSLSE